MNESRRQTGCLSLLNLTFPEGEFGHEGLNVVVVLRI